MKSNTHEALLLTFLVAPVLHEQEQLDLSAKPLTPVFLLELSRAGSSFSLFVFFLMVGFPDCTEMEGGEVSSL